MGTCSLKTLVCGVVLTVIASSSNIFANSSGSSSSSNSDIDTHFCSSNKNDLSRREVEHLTDRVRHQLAIIFASLNNIYTYLGATPNPDPLSNPAVAGLIEANTAQILEAKDLILAAFVRLGVRQDILTVINDQMLAFVLGAERYAIDVNIYNSTANKPPFEVQVQDAIFLNNVASALGQTFASLTNDSQYVEIWTTISNLTTQNVQAYRGVLEDSNKFGAAPSDPASETIAAVIINGQIHKFSALFARTIVPQLAHHRCN